MKDTDRRQFRRLRLRLPVTWLSGAGRGACQTRDVSPGGMHFVLDAAEAPRVGTLLAFELTVPPGEGYSPSEGHVRGAGQVVRASAIEAGQAAVAIRFVRPLALEF